MPFSVSLTIPARCTGLDIELSGCVVVSGGVGTTNAAASAEMASSSVDHHLELHGVESRAYGAVCVHPIDAMGSVALLPASAYTVRSNRGMFSSQQSSSSNGMSVFHDAENQTVVHETDDQTDGGQCWQPPPALSIPLAPPMPLLVPAMSGMVLVGGGGSGGLHPGEVATLLVELSNSGQLPAATIDAQLLRPASGVRLTRGTGFTWYEISSPRHSLFDEAEMGEAACGRSRLELQESAVVAQLPLPPSRAIRLPIRVTAGSDGACACDLELKYAAAAADEEEEGGPAAEAAMEDAAGVGGPPPVTPHPRLRPSDSNWSRQLSMPLRVQIADGLKLSSEIIVQSDPQRLYARKHGARVDEEEEPPGCLLMLHVDNTHKSATFELSCTLGAAVTNGNATQKDDDDGVLKWTFTPSSTRKLLLPLCCIDTTNEPTNHPLPESHAMLESYLEQRRPALTPSEADALRRAHHVKATLLTAIKLSWRRRDASRGGERVGTLSLASLRLDDEQIASLSRPPILITATLGQCASPPTEAATFARSPQMRPLTVLVTNRTGRRLVKAQLRYGRGRGSGAATRRAIGLHEGASPSSPNHQTPHPGGGGGRRGSNSGVTISSSRPPSSLQDGSQPGRRSTPTAVSNLDGAMATVTVQSNPSLDMSAASPPRSRQPSDGAEVLTLRQQPSDESDKSAHQPLLSGGGSKEGRSPTASFAGGDGRSPIGSFADGRSMRSSNNSVDDDFNSDTLSRTDSASLTVPGTGGGGASGGSGAAVHGSRSSDAIGHIPSLSRTNSSGDPAASSPNEPFAQPVPRQPPPGGAATSNSGSAPLIGGSSSNMLPLSPLRFDLKFVQRQRSSSGEGEGGGGGGGGEAVVSSASAWDPQLASSASAAASTTTHPHAGPSGPGGGGAAAAAADDGGDAARSMIEAYCGAGGGEQSRLWRRRRRRRRRKPQASMTTTTTRGSSTGSYGAVRSMPACRRSRPERRLCIRCRSA